MTSIDALAFAEILDALPARLRKRLDAAAERAADWAREPDPAAEPGSGGELIRVDEDTTVTLRPSGGVVRSAADVVCSCLLAPACLHRAAIASRLPVFEPEGDIDATTATEPEPRPQPDTPPSELAEFAELSESVESAESAESARTAESAEPAAVIAKSETEGGASLTARERAAVEALWEAASAVLIAGLVGAGLFTEAELARATHQVRALKLHRAAALGARVGAGLRIAHERRGEERLDLFTSDLRELLLTAHRLLHATDPATLVEARGNSRRSYREHGSLRLYGLFTEPVIPRRIGHAGVVGYAVDGDGLIWSSASIGPGGPELVRPSYDAALKLGGTTLTQREFSRSGLLVSGASSSTDGRLSSGGSTKAVRTGGVAWSAEPIAGLFAEPLAAQFARALRADRESETYRAGDDLVFLSARVLGVDQGGDALILELADPEDPSDSSGPPAGLIRCVASTVAAVYRRNFERLAELEPRIRLIARPDTSSPGTVFALAVHDPELPVPDAWAGCVNLGLDRIPAVEDVAVLADPARIAAPDDPASATAAAAVFAADQTSLHLVRSHVEQAVSAGRAITRTATLERDTARLDRDALHTAAELLRTLSAQAESVRDEFQHPVDTADHPKHGYPLAWLSAAVYAQAAAEELTVSRWLRALG
jgi:hypothetical protein